MTNQYLNGKTILLGITGSIAAYKTLDWARNLKAAGADVHVIMSKAACRFVGPLSFAALTGNQVHTKMFDEATAHLIPHINLARKADLVLLAPATARTIGKLAGGLADELLIAVIMATTAPVVICPAMNTNMLQHPATEENICKLKKWGCRFVEASHGTMACGEEGAGRLAEWETVRETLLALLTPQNLLNKKILVTAGPTREPLDPARFISNPATGKMGYAIAKAAKRRGAQVTLVSGPANLSSPDDMDVIRIETALEMRQAVLDHASSADVIVMAAAVSDHRPSEKAANKLKKGEMADSIALATNPDILKELGEQKKLGNITAFLLGFAAETNNFTEEGQRKLKEKNLDLIAVNDISRDDSGFAKDTNQVLLLERSGKKIEFPLLSKEETADRILDAVASLVQVE